MTIPTGRFNGISCVLRLFFINIPEAVPKIYSNMCVDPHAFSVFVYSSRDTGISLEHIGIVMLPSFSLASYKLSTSMNGNLFIPTL